MDYRSAVQEATSPKWVRLLNLPGPPRLGHHVSEDLGWMQVQSRRGDLDLLPTNFHAVWFAFMREARRSADLAEMAVIQDMIDRRLGWARIARLLGPDAGSRQAIQERWKRLLAKYSVSPADNSIADVPVDPEALPERR